MTRTAYRHRPWQKDARTIIGPGVSGDWYCGRPAQATIQRPPLGEYAGTALPTCSLGETCCGAPSLFVCALPTAARDGHAAVREERDYSPVTAVGHNDWLAADPDSRWVPLKCLCRSEARSARGQEVRA
ncbi:MAG: hypothetical protein ACHQAV_05805 [Solirubrobacterales bacterium]